MTHAPHWHGFWLKFVSPDRWLCSVGEIKMISRESCHHDWFASLVCEITWYHDSSPWSILHSNQMGSPFKESLLLAIYPMIDLWSQKNQNIQSLWSRISLIPQDSKHRSPAAQLRPRRHQGLWKPFGLGCQEPTWPGQRFSASETSRKTRVFLGKIMVWLVVWNIFFPYIGNNHPKWLIFFRGVQTIKIQLADLGKPMQMDRWNFGMAACLVNLWWFVLAAQLHILRQ